MKPSAVKGVGFRYDHSWDVFECVQVDGMEVYTWEWKPVYFDEIKRVDKVLIVFYKQMSYSAVHHFLPKNWTL